VTQHASRLIIQFMAACCGKSKTREEAEDAQLREEKPRNVPSNTVPLTRVHAILERMSRGEDDETVPVRPGTNKTKKRKRPARRPQALTSMHRPCGSRPRYRAPCVRRHDCGRRTPESGQRMWWTSETRR